MSRRKRNRRWITKLLVLVMFVLGIYFVWSGISKKNVIDNNGGNDDTSQAIATDSGESVSSVEKSDIGESIDDYIDKRPVQYDGGSPNESEYLTGAVNYVKTNGGKLLIRVSIDQYLEGGTCELALMQGDETMYQETVDIIGDATTSTCKGFDVPVAGLASGEAQFTVYFASGDRVGEVSGGVNI